MAMSRKKLKELNREIDQNQATRAIQTKKQVIWTGTHYTERLMKMILDRTRTRDAPIDLTMALSEEERHAVGVVCGLCVAHSAFCESSERHKLGDALAQLATGLSTVFMEPGSVVIDPFDYTELKESELVRMVEDAEAIAGVIQDGGDVDGLLDAMISRSKEDIERAKLDGPDGDRADSWSVFMLRYEDWKQVMPDLIEAIPPGAYKAFKKSLQKIERELEVLQSSRPAGQFIGGIAFGVPITSERAVWEVLADNRILDHENQPVVRFSGDEDGNVEIDYNLLKKVGDDYAARINMDLSGMTLCDGEFYNA